MIAYYQKNKLKILLAVFCLALILPFFSLSKTALAADPEPGMLESYIVIPLLKTVLKFVTILLSVAETIFEWIVNPKTMLAIMTNSAVYTTWRAVRDIFNVVFIMVLLFSAFATVFQYSKFNYKNVLLNLVLMALLVNFSYPIARFIVDFSNIIMFGFLQSMGGDNSFMAIIKNSGLDKIIGGSNPGALFLLSAVIFTFILAITLLIIAVLLVIRTVSLTLYIIFSPLAFVGSVLPGTKLASAGNEWWTDFMKNCFAGPIIVFMLYVANVLMSAMASSGGQIKNIANVQVNGLEDPGNISQLITGVSIFILSIIVLWMGIIKSQESGIIGAKAVVGYGKKAMKWGSGLTFATNVQKAYQSRRAKAREDSWANKLGANLGSQQDRLRGSLPGGTDARLRYEADQSTKIKKEAERNAVTTADDLELERLAASGNKFEQAAATIELAARGLATGVQLNNIRQEFGNDSQVTRQLENKMKPYAVDAVFTRNGILDEVGLTRYMQSDNFNPEKLNGNALRNERLLEIGFETGTINNDNLEKLRRKNPAALTTSLRNIATRATDVTIEAHRNIQMAHFAQTGDIQNALFSERIFQDMNKDTAKRMSTATLNTIALNTPNFANNVNVGRYKDIIMNMTDRTVQRDLNRLIRTAPTGTLSAQGQALQRVAQNDSALRHI